MLYQISARTFCLFALVFATWTAHAFLPSSNQHQSYTSFSAAASTSPTSTTSALNMKEVNVGDTLPLQVQVSELQQEGGKAVTAPLGDIIQGKRVAIFGVPGAFTPSCHKSHLPSFVEAQDELKQKGIDMTICVATNDAYTLEAWGRMTGAADSGIRFLSDSTGELTQQLGLTMETPTGIRTKRFSLIADTEGRVTNYFSSAKDSSDTYAPNVLSNL